MHLVDDFRPMTSSGDPTQPGICKFGEPRSRDGFDSVAVDNIWNQMNGQSDDGTRGDDGGRVVVDETEGWGRHYEGS